MKNIIYTTIILCLPFIGWSQKQHKINQSSGILKILGIDALEVVGYDGSEVIFVSNGHDDDDKNDRSKGLRVINSIGLRDNSGLGLAIDQDGDVTSVQQISNGASCNCDDGYTIKVPRNLNLYVEHSTIYGEDVKINNVSGEIEISVNYNDVYLEKVTGPLAIKTVYGDLETSFSTVNQNSPISLVSVYGHVDVSMPVNTRADLSVKTNYGALYSDMDIKVQTVDENGKMKSVSTKKINGTMNGGGVEINLSSLYEDVYLRSSNLSKN